MWTWNYRGNLHTVRSCTKLIVVSDSNNSFDDVFMLLTGFMCKTRRHMKNSGKFSSVSAHIIQIDCWFGAVWFWKTSWKCLKWAWFSTDNCSPPIDDQAPLKWFSLSTVNTNWKVQAALGNDPSVNYRAKEMQNFFFFFSLCVFCPGWNSSDHIWVSGCTQTHVKHWFQHFTK